MRPDGPVVEPSRWQQQKSARTRAGLIEASIDCLVEKGYSGLSTSSVAERAGVSRGAMHHHFATRMDLVSALVEHVFYQRMHEFVTAYIGAGGSGQGTDRMVEIASDLHWQSVQTREYAAYIELAVAARTDPELDAHFAPVAQRFDDVWVREMIETFPQWREHWDAMKLGNDFTIAAHMGMLLQRPVLGPARLEEVRKLVARVVRSLYDMP
ncbi:TetR/AcrR family transcriptional regulator [Novosphingobium lentum]|uniref:TetR/AcrR family transcriptional regulator n=1 Tax=Novosphingobium lentum TaxID=145287 RepID=UPI000AE299D2|nr:TetR/AcrR family transcriptional regulator [Novosphingobium lentum]